MALIKNLPFIVKSMSDTSNLYETLDDSSKKLLQSLIDKLIPGSEKGQDASKTKAEGEYRQEDMFGGERETGT